MEGTRLTAFLEGMGAHCGASGTSGAFGAFANGAHASLRSKSLPQRKCCSEGLLGALDATVRSAKGKAECWDSRRQLWAFAEVVYNGTDGAHSQLPASALAKRFGEVPGVVLVDLGRIGVHPRRPFAKDSTPTRLCRRWAAGSACLDSSRALQYVRQCA